MAYSLHTVRKRMLRNARRRAKELNLPFNLEERDICVPAYCPILGVPLEVGSLDRDNSPSLDRIIPERGYTRGNVVVLSMRANRLKSDASLDELKSLVSFLSQLIDDKENTK